MRPVAAPRIKPCHHPGDPEFVFFRANCATERCSAPLGELHPLLWDGVGSITDPNANIIQPTAAGFTGVSDDPTLGRYDFTLGVRLGPRVHVEDVVDVEGPDRPWKRVWVAYHKLGYRQRSNSELGLCEFEVLRPKSPIRDRRAEGPRRLRGGRRPLPPDDQARLRGRMLVPQKHLTRDGHGVIGARPVLPAVIRCPKCGRPHLMGAPGLEGRGGTAHT
jgi:hypothetical protein